MARDTQGNAIASTAIGIQISILKSSSTGVPQYTENHTVTTDAFGLFNLVIGAGSIQSGDMASIDWSNDNYYLQVGMDAAGGTNFLTMGTTQLLSVPYALYAKSAGSVNSGTGITISSISVTGDSLFLSNGQTFVSGGNSGGNSGGSPVNGFSHYIGEVFGGGIIFHLRKDAQGIEHGLILDITLNTIIYPNVPSTFNFIGNYEIWSNIQGPFPFPSFGFNGLVNSNNIIQQNGHTNSAALYCLNLTSAGQTDWYLPSIGELSLLWNNFTEVEQTLSQITGISLTNEIYDLPSPGSIFSSGAFWSSTPGRYSLYGALSDQYAWYFDFARGIAEADKTKDSSLRVIAIRAF